jgi:hypothetical protein
MEAVTFESRIAATAAGFDPDLWKCITFVAASPRPACVHSNATR